MLHVEDYFLGDHIGDKQLILHTKELINVHEVQDITNIIFTSRFGCLSFQYSMGDFLDLDQVMNWPITLQWSRPVCAWAS